MVLSNFIGDHFQDRCLAPLLELTGANAPITTILMTALKRVSLYTHCLCYLRGVLLCSLYRVWCKYWNALSKGCSTEMGQLKYTRSFTPIWYMHTANLFTAKTAGFHCTANTYSQRAVEVHSKTCPLKESTGFWLY